MNINFSTNFLTLCLFRSCNSSKNATTEKCDVYMTDDIAVVRCKLTKCVSNSDQKGRKTGHYQVPSNWLKVTQIKKGQWTAEGRPMAVWAA